MPLGIRAGDRGLGCHVLLWRAPSRGSGDEPTTSPKESLMDPTTDSRIRADVYAALADDPPLPFADEIAVSAYDGTVTLRGTVGSFAQRHAAVSDTRRIAGVSGVYVEDGWVTLRGDVDFQFQSDAAFNDVAHLHGVTGVTNKIRVTEARVA